MLTALLSFATTPIFSCVCDDNSVTVCDHSQLLASNHVTMYKPVNTQFNFSHEPGQNLMNTTSSEKTSLLSLYGSSLSSLFWGLSIHLTSGKVLHEIPTIHHFSKFMEYSSNYKSSKCVDIIL